MRTTTKTTRRSLTGWIARVVAASAMLPGFAVAGQPTWQSLAHDPPEWLLDGKFNFSPRADGSIPEPQRDTLLGVGEWLRKNGEAIYDTRPWKIAAEGDETKLRLTKGWEFAACDGSDIRFTRSKDGGTLCAIALGWPEDGRLRINSLGLQTRVAEDGVRSVTLIDGGKPVNWTRNGLGLILEMPPGTPRRGACLRVPDRGRGKAATRLKPVRPMVRN